ncbi:MAG: Hpt domain-containing protein [Planctomycetota bacterium]|jgi:HPt (histidine-containing phosphotransfer) domain-containing protein
MDEPVLNPAQMIELAGDDLEIIEELVQIVFDDFPCRIQGLQTALTDQEVTAALFEAHSLKGSATSMGFEALAAIARACEDCIKEEQMEKAEALARSLDPAYEALFQQLGTTEWEDLLNQDNA